MEDLDGVWSGDVEYDFPDDESDKSTNGSNHSDFKPASLLSTMPEDFIKMCRVIRPPTSPEWHEAESNLDWALLELKDHKVAAFSGAQTFCVGNSGSLVIDATTRQPYGYVIAVDPLGEAYVMPLQNTLRQIKTALRTEDVELLSKPSWAITAVAAPNPVAIISRDNGVTTARKPARMPHVPSLERKKGGNLESVVND
ncbi:hypothetical protein B0H63DRAFT_450252 [Podospora didyma]|uniref:Uncharacterized protein n=1 Tax=Podospora didyma TaxID=330526 RepID=A0AAE0TVC1_9PEZI|nr:hypothetical protein B0H63DRAFT_450252 [Podospora didyma]